MNSIIYRRDRGVALIIVLSMVVLVTMVTVAFFSRAELNRKISAVSGGGVQADAIAKGGIDVIIGDLKSEIVQGSGSKGSGDAYYTPSATNTIYPYRQAGTAVRNLLKISSNKAPYEGTGYTKAGPIRASSTASISAATTVASANKRIFSRARWMAPKMVLDTTEENAFPIPQWIYVTQKGDFGGYYVGSTWNQLLEDNITILATNGSRPAVGRIAYAVYDIGGLLDINAAGNTLPSGDTGNQHRGRLHHADLSAIEAANLDIADFLEERNPKTHGNTAESTNPNEGEGGLFDAKRDFVKVNTVGSGSTATKEEVFLTRQHLIEYSMNGGAIASTRLPDLTIFTREKNAPVWNTTTASTPSLALSLAESAKLKQRFPLSKIRLLSEDMTHSDIQKFFGLTWDETDKVWVYKQKTPALDKIRTLAELGSGEEPNFFEILKSIIAPSTLGTIPTGISTPAGSTFTVDEKKRDAQIFQIGANIIDQYDSDDFPVDIFVPLADTNVQNPANRFFGVENLPYLSRVAGVFQTAKDATTLQVTVDARLLPEFTILHSDLKSGFNDVRLRVVGQASLLMGDATTLAPVISKSFTDNNATGEGKFSAGSTAADVLLLKPYLSGLDTGVTHAWYNGQPDGTPPTAFTGILVAAGQPAPVPSGANPPNPFYAIDSGTGTGGTPLTFILEYNAKTAATDPDDYRPYAIWRDIKVGSAAPSAHPLRVETSNADGEITGFKTTALSAWVKADPRTERQEATWMNMTLSLASAPVAVTSDHINRAFRGVGDLSYVFRDIPNTNLRFNEENSPDAALLEFFSVTDSTESEDKAIGGRLALNSRSTVALEAVLRGSALTSTDTTGLGTTAATTAAGIVTGSNGAIVTRSELINRLTDTGSGLARVRALAEIGNTRTWNLLIDVVAQAGRIPQGATGNVSSKFVVEGERRYWIHVAIDRYTGEEVGSRIIELVKE